MAAQTHAPVFALRASVSCRLGAESQDETLFVTSSPCSSTTQPAQLTRSVTIENPATRGKTVTLATLYRRSGTPESRTASEGRPSQTSSPPSEGRTARRLRRRLINLFRFGRPQDRRRRHQGPLSAKNNRRTQATHQLPTRGQEPPPDSLPGLLLMRSVAELARQAKDAGG